MEKDLKKLAKKLEEMDRKYINKAEILFKLGFGNESGLYREFGSKIYSILFELKEALGINEEEEEQ
jgi:hypothetical protein